LYPNKPAHRSLAATVPGTLWAGGQRPLIQHLFRTFDPGHRAVNTTFDNENQGTGTMFRRSASIGILTYRRPEEVKRCLEAVVAAIAEPMPDSWSVDEVMVIDNDPDGSARAVVSKLAERTVSAASIRYVHEPRAGVSIARNRAMAEAAGDVLVFIDDDEIPHEGWPHGLLTVLDETGAAMVGGPVLTEFTAPPPRWIVDGRFFDRDDAPHRSARAWLRSGNLAIDLEQVRGAGLLFDPRYRQGEDSAFTRAARAAGLELRWSSVGAITEFVGADRFSTRWRARREYLSNRAWTRSSLDLADGATGRAASRARVATVALARAGQGLALMAAGLWPGRADRRAEGLAVWAGVGGRIVEIMAYRRP